jgi:S1-C subfamily serine protease
LVDEMDALPGVGEQSVEVRVGVNTGEALVRLDVDPASGQGFLTGDAVNVAARLQSAAPPMAVAVGEATHAATRKVFSFDSCHPVALKGKSKPLAAWIATAPLARTGSELRSFSSDFVGREDELAALQELLDAAVEDRHPRFALVCGEPGIGKSRLLAEFSRRLDDRPTVVTWRQGRCLPFGSGVTFWALSEIVRAEAGILESDGVARTEARLQAVLPVGEAHDRLRSRLRPLLGLEADQASRDENFSAWREFLESFAADGPAVVVVEDLHWADEAMLAFMDSVTDSTADVPLLILATARPEVLELAGPGAGYAAAAASLPLGPLSGEETAELARARLGAKSLPTDLHALILERSGGNPLFAEELVRLLEDRELLQSRGGKVSLKPGADVPMPESISSLIAARLDLLTPARKALLSDAAVVGRSFWAGAVAAVGPHEAAHVFEGLHELVAKELVRPERGSSMAGETEFVFVHALVCDVAYAQLTRADRAAKHAALARWLEERTAGRTEDLAEILAFHYGTALEMATSAGLFELEDELSEPTARYLALAGGRAAPLDAAAAAAHFARAERVADEAARPKRRWLLSRRTRRTLRRRAPLLVAAAAVILVAAVAGLAVWEFRPASGPSGPVRLTAVQIANKYGASVVDVTARVPRIVHRRLTWKTITERGVIASKDGLIYTGGGRLQDTRLGWYAQVATVGVYGSEGQYRRVRGRRLDAGDDGGYAIFQVDPKKVQLHPIPLGDPLSLRRGEQVVILGRQWTDLWQVTAKIQRVLRDSSPSMNRVNAMMTDAGFMKSRRGCPVIDTTGRLVGVMGSYDEPMVAFSGNNAAVSSSYFTNAARWYRRQVVQWPSRWLGVSVRTVSPRFARKYGLATRSGALVQFVVPGSPAAAAGMRAGSLVATVRGMLLADWDRELHKVIGWNEDTKTPEECVLGGDVIVGVNDKAVTSADRLALLLWKGTKVGDVVTIHLLRGGKPLTLKATLAANLRWNSPWL